MYLPNRPGATATDHGTLLIAAEKTINNFVFAVIPLFVLMGFLVAAAGIGGSRTTTFSPNGRRRKRGAGYCVASSPWISRLEELTFDLNVPFKPLSTSRRSVQRRFRLRPSCSADNRR